MKMKELPKEERPRERLKKFGSDALSNLELIEILLQTGTKTKDLKTLGEEVLLLLERKEIPTLQELQRIDGLGEAKALLLLASFEFSKRFLLSPQEERKKITSPKSAYQYTKSFFFHKKQECFYCLYLDAHKEVIGEKMLFQGTIDRSTVHPREVFKEAYRMGASSIICLHNHPSGFLEPSSMDVAFTEKLVTIGKIQELPILDHIIVGENDYYSFMEHENLIFNNDKVMI